MSEEIKRIITIEDKGSETLKKLGDVASDAAVDLNKVTVSTTDLKKAQTDSLQGINDVGGAIGQLNPKVGQLTTGVGNFKKALQALKANPITLAISAVVGVIYGLVKAIKSNKEAVEQIQKSTAKFKPLVDAFKKVLDGIIGTVTKVVSGVLNLSAKILGLSDNTKSASNNIAALKDNVEELEVAYNNLGGAVEKSSKKSDVDTDYRISKIRLEISELKKKKELATNSREINNIEKEIAVREQVIEKLEIERDRREKLNKILEEFFNSDEFKEKAADAYKKLGLGKPISDDELKAYQAKMNEYKYIIVSSREQLEEYLKFEPKTQEQADYREKMIRQLEKRINDTQMLYNSVERQLEKKQKDASTTLEQFVSDFINTIAEEINLGQPASIILDQMSAVFGENSDVFKMFETILNNYQVSLDEYFSKNKKTNKNFKEYGDLIKSSLDVDLDVSQIIKTSAAIDDLNRGVEKLYNVIERPPVSETGGIPATIEGWILALKNFSALSDATQEKIRENIGLVVDFTTAITDGLSSSFNNIAQCFDQTTAEGLESYKRFATASTIISTAGGVVAAIKSGFEAGGPLGWAVAAANALSVITAGAAQLATIKRAGESDSLGSTGLSGATKTTVYSPYSTTANIGSASIGALSGIIGDQKVYVTESDITKAQNSKKVKVEESRQ